MRRDRTHLPRFPAGTHRNACQGRHLHRLLRAFREVLLPDLDEESFADMYAQTVCYGLFASICNAEFPQTFARENAADNLPATNPFLRRLFHHIVGPDLHSRVREDTERVVYFSGGCSALTLRCKAVRMHYT